MNLSRKTVQRRTLKGARLRKHGDYQRAYAAARKRQSTSMSWFLAPQGQVAPLGELASQGQRVSPSQLVSPSQINAQPETACDRPGARVGLTAGKVLGKAHERNRIKRRMREAVRKNLSCLQSDVDVILHPRKSVLAMEFPRLTVEISRVFQSVEAALSKAGQETTS